MLSLLPLFALPLLLLPALPLLLCQPCLLALFLFALLCHNNLSLVVRPGVQLQSHRLHPVFGLGSSHGGGGVAFAGGRHGKDREDVGIDTTSDFSYRCQNSNSDKGGGLHIVFITEPHCGLMGLTLRGGYCHDHANSGTSHNQLRPYCRPVSHSWTHIHFPGPRLHLALLKVRFTIITLAHQPCKCP